MDGEGYMAGSGKVCAGGIIHIGFAVCLYTRKLHAAGAREVTRVIQLSSYNFVTTPLHCLGF